MTAELIYLQPPVPAPVVAPAALPKLADDWMGYATNLQALANAAIQRDDYSLFVLAKLASNVVHSYQWHQEGEDVWRQKPPDRFWDGHLRDWLSHAGPLPLPLRSDHLHWPWQEREAVLRHSLAWFSRQLTERLLVMLPSFDTLTTAANDNGNRPLLLARLQLFAMSRALIKNIPVTPAALRLKLVYMQQRLYHLKTNQGSAANWLELGYNSAVAGVMALTILQPDNGPLA